MTRSEAVELISTPGIVRTAPQIWYDFGCGSGTFTLALADLLSPGSIIHAFDKDEKAFDRVPDRHLEVEIRKAVKNLADSNLHLGAVDGILMANFLHFIPEQTAFFRRVIQFARQFLVVEYDTSTPSVWVPHPLAFPRLRMQFLQAGVSTVEKIGTRRSRYRGEMYSAIAQRS